MNSHLEEKRNDTKRQQLINDGKILQLHVDGNVGADAQAKLGADTEGHAVPAPMIEGSHIRADMARTAQNMMYTIWAQRMQEENDPALSTQLHAEATHIQSLQHPTTNDIHDDEDYDELLWDRSTSTVKIRTTPPTTTTYKTT